MILIKQDYLFSNHQKYLIHTKRKVSCLSFSAKVLGKCSSVQIFSPVVQKASSVSGVQLGVFLLTPLMR